MSLLILFCIGVYAVSVYSIVRNLRKKYDRAIAALEAALEGYQDCMPYKGEFLADKHGDLEELEVLEAELDALRR